MKRWDATYVYRVLLCRAVLLAEASDVALSGLQRQGLESVAVPSLSQRLPPTICASLRHAGFGASSANRQGLVTE